MKSRETDIWWDLRRVAVVVVVVVVVPMALVFCFSFKCSVHCK